MTTLINADCLHALKTIQTHSIDLVLADPPYGTTACDWDTPIPLAPLWRELERVIRPHGAIVLFAAQPFTTTLIASNLVMFKYCWVWEKNQPGGFAQAKNKPLSRHEDICVFSTGVTVHQGQSARRMPYFPQGLTRIDKTVTGSFRDRPSALAARPSHRHRYVQTHTGYPSSILKVACERGGLHPTQKPVALMNYLIRTYTKPGACVLDFAMGSGTTGVACRELHRRFIGIEKDRAIFAIARRRLKNQPVASQR